MRFVLAMVLAGLVGFPLSASAQEVEEGATLEPKAEEAAPPSEPVPEEPVPLSESAPEEPAPPSEPAPEEPALQLKLDDAGVDVAPSPPRTPDGYTLEEMELRVKRPKIGIGVSAGALAAGMAMGLAVLGASMCPFVFPADTTCPPSWVDPVGYAGLVLGVGGLAGIIASGILLRKRKRDRDSLRYAHIGTPRRAQWDVARSRLVF